MSQATYLVELCCDGQVLESTFVTAGGPRHAPYVMLFDGDDGPFNPEEDYFRVVDPAVPGSEWFWHFRDGTIQRLLRPPVSPGSLPPSP